MKKSVLLLIALILGILYSVFILSYFSETILGNNGDMLTYGIVSILVGPHIFMTLLAVLFNLIAYINKRKGFALTTGILYAVAAFLFMPYAFYVVIQSILSFIAFARMQKT